LHGRCRGRVAAGANGRGQGAPLDGTLKKLADDGVVVVGYREASIPFSYYDDAKNPVGYSMDLTAAIRESCASRPAHAALPKSESHRRCHRFYD
jgi:ABC-type amino acid transport substrate-binding protein